MLKALELIETIPYPGSREEQSVTYDAQDVGEEAGADPGVEIGGGHMVSASL